MWCVSVCFLALLCAAAAAAAAAAAGGTEPNKKKVVKNQAPSRGWGASISWVKSYEEGLIKMAASGKPLMIIHHRDDCPHSQALKKRFVVEKTITKLAKEGFIMLNVVEETPDPNLAPDGHYVPRILFVDPSMTVRADIKGKFYNRLYAYEPDDMDTLAENMRRAKVLLHPEL